jgi:hypothetical protein
VHEQHRKRFEFPPNGVENQPQSLERSCPEEEYAIRTEHHRGRAHDALVLEVGVANRQLDDFTVRQDELSLRRGFQSQR